MGDFRRGGGGGFRGRERGRGRDRGPVTMHHAVCDQCGKDCEVPFRPSGDKPVYCNDCFGSKKDNGGSRGGDRYPQKSFESFQAPAKSDLASSSNDEIKKQLVMLNEKMERLIKAVSSTPNTYPAKTEQKVKTIVKALPVVKAKKVVKKKTKK